MSRREKFKAIGAMTGRGGAILSSTALGGMFGSAGSVAVYIAVTEGLSVVTTTAIGAFFTGPPGWVAWLALALGTTIGIVAGYRVGDTEEEYIGIGEKLGGLAGEGAAVSLDFILGDDLRQQRELEERAAQAQQELVVVRHQTEASRQETQQALTETQQTQAQVEQLKRELAEKAKMVTRYKEFFESKGDQTKVEQDKSKVLQKKVELLEDINKTNSEMILQLMASNSKTSAELAEAEKVVAVTRSTMKKIDELVLCPLGVDVMVTPITPGDGNCYEEKELKRFCNHELEKGKIFMPLELLKSLRESGKSLPKGGEEKYICSPVNTKPFLPLYLWTKDHNMQSLIDQYRKNKEQNEQEEKPTKPTPSSGAIPLTPTQEESSLAGQRFRVVGSTSSTFSTGSVQESSVEVNSPS